MAEPLYKTTIVIWSRFDGNEHELTMLAQEATDGVAICTEQQSVTVPDDEVPDEVRSFFNVLDED